MLLCTFLLLTGLLLLWVRERLTPRGHLPPGPPPLPFLGNILQLDHKGLLKSFQKLRKKYGVVFTFYLGTRPTIIMCGFKAIQEALVDQGEAFLGRGRIAVLDPIFQGTGKCICLSEGIAWTKLFIFFTTVPQNFSVASSADPKEINIVPWKSGVIKLPPIYQIHFLSH